MVRIGLRATVSLASYRGRRQLAEEVPGLYIRRLTLEDPRSARESSGSRSVSPTTLRHVCHPASGYVPSARRSSSYRSWLERNRKERPPFLTIVPLELPESPVPLIQSQSWRGDRAIRGSAVLGDLVLRVQEERTKRKPSSPNRRKAENHRLLECSREQQSLQQCTRNIVQGERSTNPRGPVECICSEVPDRPDSQPELEPVLEKELQLDLELVSPSSSRCSSPELSRTIRIAMSYQREAQEVDEDEDRSKTRLDRTKRSGRDQPGAVNQRSGGSAQGFGLNCTSLRLTSRGKARAT